MCWVSSFVRVVPFRGVGSVSPNRPVPYRLAHQGQTEPPPYRALSRTQNIRVRLGGSGSMMEDFPDKPTGMHWKTYLRLFHKAIVDEQISNQAMMNWIGAHRARIG